MSTSRAVLLLGMHRSGTSAIARGLGALGVYLGDDFPRRAAGKSDRILGRQRRPLRSTNGSSGCWDSVGTMRRRSTAGRLSDAAFERCGAMRSAI